MLRFERRPRKKGYQREEGRVREGGGERWRKADGGGTKFVPRPRSELDLPKCARGHLELNTQSIYRGGKGRLRTLGGHYQKVIREKKTLFPWSERDTKGIETKKRGGMKEQLSGGADISATVIVTGTRLKEGAVYSRLRGEKNDQKRFQTRLPTPRRGSVAQPPINQKSHRAALSHGRGAEKEGRWGEPKKSNLGENVVWFEV